MDNTFAANLRRIRKERSITQEQLAEAVGVSAQAVSKWEISGYPDAGLLPDIADKLGVTIDELYGRTHEDKSLYLRIIEHIQSFPPDKQISEMVNMCYAMPQACMGVHDYSPIDSYILKAEDWSNFSQYITRTGMLEKRNNASLHYFLMLPEPEKGYDDVLRYDENMVKLFAFLAVPNALRAVYMLMGYDCMTFFKRETITDKLGITEKNAQEILDRMNELGFLLDTVLNDGKKEEHIYYFRVGNLFVEFLTFTWLLLHQPDNFNYQTNNRGGRRYFKNETYKVKKNEEKTD